MNKDDRVINEFGEEWKKFNFSQLNKESLIDNYQQYFSIFPWKLINKNSEGFDMGAGSGRWAQFVAPQVGYLNCIEPSEAINVAKRNLSSFKNISFFQETTDTCSLKADSQDFGYCLGVLHHIPDTQSALKDCANLLKSGAPFLLYLYYDFENKPSWFRFIWKCSNLFRKFISKLPLIIKKPICEVIALAIYWPLSRLALLLELVGMNVENIPLTDYRNKPYYQLRNDALDRFGTRLEQRFSRTKITYMLEKAGFKDISFSDSTPYWCCLSYKS